MKKVIAPAIAGICGVFMLAGTASADFVMLTVELFANNWNTSDAEFDGNIPDGQLRDVYRVYAHFNDPNDRMTAIGVALDGTPMTVENVLFDGITPGSGLYEALFGSAAEGGGPIADTSSGWSFNPTGLTFDTFMTIGNATGYTPVIDPKTDGPYIFGWVTFPPDWGVGTSWVIDSNAFVTIPASPYGQPDVNGRVLVAQFNVANGEHIQGFANIQWGIAGLLGGGITNDVYFTSIPPFPADITGLGGVPDGCVDAFDLGAMLGAWCSGVNDPRPPPPPHPEKKTPPQPPPGQHPGPPHPPR
ncbi:MAG: hypothetical protein O7D97_05395, partial [Planctomycetota bacterium]|nr:hypothetical protein [Planctomycetota bacterium]